MKNCQYCKSEIVTFEGEEQAVILDKIHGYCHELRETILSIHLEKYQRNPLLDLVDRMENDFPHNGEIEDTLNDHSCIEY